MCAESERMYLPGVLYLAGGLEVGGGVWGGVAPGPEEQNPRGPGLLLLRVLQEHPAVVPRLRDGLHTRVVDL